MDTGYDFIQPEFFNILFFQQKNLVIFPYVDVKHLHSLEIFAVGYNIVDLDTTALHNLREILELERYNSYSQNPSFFFITNVNSDQLQEIMNLENIHCIINCREDVKPYANGNNFLFYNKKNNTFLNYTPENLAFEKSLITSSKNISVLQDKILKIKTIATNIFTELNESCNTQAISKILSEIELQYWDKVLEFTQLYYGIEVPDISVRTLPSVQEKRPFTKSFSDEYDVIISKNKKIAKEFTQLIHDYRSKKVNSANLEVEELFFPRNLYDYLRNHHWKDGIDEEFLVEWVNMNISKCPLNEEDLLDFQKIFNFLGVSLQILSDFPLNYPNTNESKLENNEIKQSEIMSTQAEKISDITPSIENFSQFKAWILRDLNEIEKLAESDILAETVPYFLSELSELRQDLCIIEGKDKFYIRQPQKQIFNLDKIHIQKIPNQIIRRLLINAEEVYKKNKELSEEFDASYIISGYTKALEAILDEKLSSCLRPLIVKYHAKYDKKELSPDFNKKFGPLLSGKSISLGTWISIIKSINTYQKDPDVQEFLNHLKYTFDEYTLDTIKRACEIVNAKRNIALHYNRKQPILTLKYIKLLRKRFIVALSPLVELLY